MWGCIYRSLLDFGHRATYTQFHLIPMIIWRVTIVLSTWRSKGRRRDHWYQCWGSERVGLFQPSLLLFHCTENVVKISLESLPGRTDTEQTHMSCTIRSLTTEPTGENPWKKPLGGWVCLMKTAHLWGVCGNTSSFPLNYHFPLSPNYENNCVIFPLYSLCLNTATARCCSQRKIGQQATTRRWGPSLFGEKRGCSSQTLGPNFHSWRETA